MIEQYLYNTVRFLVDFTKIMIGYYLYKNEVDPAYVFLYIFILPYIDIYLHQLKETFLVYFEIYLPVMGVMYDISCELMGKDILLKSEYIHEFFIKVLLFNHADIQFAEKKEILEFFREPLTAEDHYVATQCFIERWALSLLRYSTQVTDSLAWSWIPYGTTTKQSVIYDAKSFMYEIYYLEFFDFFFNENIKNLISVENAQVLQDEKVKFPVALTKCMGTVFENFVNTIDGVYQRQITTYHSNMELNLYMYNEVKKYLGHYSYKGVLLNYVYNSMFLRQYCELEMNHIFDRQPVGTSSILMNRIDWYLNSGAPGAQAKFSIYKFPKPVFFNKNIIYEGGFRYIEWYKPFDYSKGFTAESLDNISPFVIPVMSDEL